MKAWYAVRQGPPSVGLKLVNDAPTPQPKAGDVLVKVQAAALNPVGYKLLKLLPNFMARRPHIAEYDLAGVVEDPNGDSRFKKGDNVWGWIPSELAMKYKFGALAELTLVPGSHLAHRPPSITVEQASGVALVTMTAMQMLQDLEPGQSIFINGGSTSVGIAAIQIAKAHGCFVGASCSSKNAEFVRSLGADVTFDYRESPLAQQLSNGGQIYNVFFETVGDPAHTLFTQSPSYLAKGGHFISVGPNGSSGREWLQAFRTMFEGFLRPTRLGGTPREYRINFVKHNPKNMETIASLLADGKLVPQVDSVHPFDDALLAYDRLMSGRARGKVVVRLSD